MDMSMIEINEHVFDIVLTIIGVATLFFVIKGYYANRHRLRIGRPDHKPGTNKFKVKISNPNDSKILVFDEAFVRIKCKKYPMQISATPPVRDDLNVGRYIVIAPMTYDITLVYDNIPKGKKGKLMLTSNGKRISVFRKVLLN